MAEGVEGGARYVGVGRTRRRLRKAAKYDQLQVVRLCARVRCSSALVLFRRDDAALECDCLVPWCRRLGESAAIHCGRAALPPTGDPSSGSSHC